MGVAWVELPGELVHLRGLDGLLRLGVHLGRVGPVARIGDGQPLVLGGLEHERYVVVNLVDVGAPGLLARERLALHHGHVHVVEDVGCHLFELEAADVVAGGLELTALAPERRQGNLLLGFPALWVAVAVLLERVGGASLDLVLLDFLDEAAQRLGGFRIGAVEGPCLGDVLVRPWVLARGRAQLPLAAPALGFVLLELDD